MTPTEKKLWDRIEAFNADRGNGRLFPMIESSERRDIYCVVLAALMEGEETEGWAVGRDGITEIFIVDKKGPNDWIPYIQVWKGSHLHAEAAQHQVAWIEFLPDPRIEP